MCLTRLAEWLYRLFVGCWRDPRALVARRLVLRGAHALASHRALVLVVLSLPAEALVVRTACQRCGGPLAVKRRSRARLEARRFCAACGPHTGRPRLPRPICGRPGCGVAVKQARDRYCSRACAQSVIHSPGYRQRKRQEAQTAEALLLEMLASLPAHDRHGRRLTAEDERQLRFALAARLNQPWSQQVGLPPRPWRLKERRQADRRLAAA